MLFVNDLQDLYALLISAFLGALIGLERELNGKPAGLRTNILICVGAAAFTILSMQIGEGTAQAAPSRLAAQIVSGVGFLGAGAIIQDRGGVQGLTTAAGIWLVASVGVACGARNYQLAFVTTVIALTALLVFQPVTRYLHKKSMKRQTKLRKKYEEQ